MSKVKTISFKFHRKKFDDIMTKHAREALRKASERLLEIMQKNVVRSLYGGPLSSEWRQEVADALTIALGRGNQYVLRQGVVLPDDDLIQLKAWLINYGVGSAHGGEPVHAGPKGRSVLDEDMLPTESISREHAMPDRYNQTRNDWIEMSYDQMEHEFLGILEVEWNDISELDLSSCWDVDSE